MKLAIVGGGGFRVPLVVRALAADPERRIDTVSLYDVDPVRLAAIAAVLADQAGDGRWSPHVVITESLDEALGGADFVFLAIRVGGLAGRVADERVALAHNLVGQETTGPGGIAYGLRTVPVAVALAERIRSLAPHAWVINFTNPAGMITEAMSAALPGRVVGICDSPIALGRRAAHALGYQLDEVALGYVGLNHLGWLRSMTVAGVDVLPRLLHDDQALSPLEETHLFGAEWLRQLGAIPNEYLHYYYFAKEAVATAHRAGETRGEFLRVQQGGFYADATSKPARAGALWHAVLAERNATYMAQERGPDVARDEIDIVSGGYEGVALALMAALAGGDPAELILNVVNAGSLPGLPPDAVVEIPCWASASAITPMKAAPLDGHFLGLAQQVKAVDQLAIAAATTANPGLAIQAFAVHPLVDSVSTARSLFAAYREAIPTFDATFRAPH